MMREVLAKLVPFSEAEYQFFESLAVRRVYGKNCLLYPAGHVSRKMLFVEQGLLRGYRLVEGSDVTYHFFTPGWFATDYQSYLTGQPGALYVETMTETTVFEFDKATLLATYATHPKLERLGRLIAERAYLIVAERLKALQVEDLESRYLNLCRQAPELFRVIAQKHIASFLGVQPQSLSRLKASLHRSGKQMP